MCHHQGHIRLGALIAHNNAKWFPIRPANHLARLQTDRHAVDDGPFFIGLAFASLHLPLLLEVAPRTQTQSALANCTQTTYNQFPHFNKYIENTSGATNVFFHKRSSGLHPSRSLFFVLNSQATLSEFARKAPSIHRICPFSHAHHQIHGGNDAKKQHAALQQLARLINLNTRCGVDLSSWH